MPHRGFNKAESYLLEKWADASRLEESMAMVRENYGQILRDVLDTVQKTHPDLDSQVLHLRQSTVGNLAIGKKTWPFKWNEDWPTGLWLDNMRLDYLLSEDKDAPDANINILTPNRLLKNEF
jgi:hypothetical protein